MPAPLLHHAIQFYIQFEVCTCTACAQIKKVDDLRGDISRLELSLGAAKAEYDKIKAANLSETARFAAERRAEYIQMLENFTATQVRSGV